METQNQGKYVGSGEAFKADMAKAGEKLRMDMLKRVTGEKEKEIYRRNLEHLAKYEGSRLFQKALSGDSSFKEEVRSFYDLTQWTPGSSFPLVPLYHETKDKVGTIPKDLVNIISEFGEEELNLKKLTYESVREDFDNLHKKENGFRYMLNVGAPLLGGAVAFTTAFVSILGLPPQGYYLIGGGFSMVLSGIAELKRKNGFFSKNSFGAYNEYQKLLQYATKADIFANNEYKDRIMKAYLAEKQKSAGTMSISGGGG